MADITNIDQLSPEQMKDAGEVSRWVAELDLARQESKTFRDQASDILKIYKDEGGKQTELTDVMGYGSFNIFWSNINVLKPALYSRIPKPEVERRYKDSDPVGRVAAQMLQRALSYSITSYDFNDVMNDCRDDFLIVGRGVAWVRYLPTFEGEEGEEQLTYEEVMCDHVHWSDFEHSPARSWKNVRWVAKRAFLSRDELVKRFGKKIAKDVPLDYSPKGAAAKEGEVVNPHEDLFNKAIVWEIWDKPSKSVIWVAPSYKLKVLDKKKDPLKLKGFFPCPKPLYSTVTTDSLVPIADYRMYQHLAKQLDQLSRKRAVLLRALKAAGVYDSSFDELKRLFDEGIDNQLIPVHDWPKFLEKRGFEGVMQFMPLKDIVSLLDQIDKSIEITKSHLFEVTGMSDLVRGVTDARETATAQQIKGEFATLRLSDRQREIQRFARDLIAIKGEIISEHFSPETLQVMTGAEVLNDLDSGIAVNFEQAMQLLRSDPLRSFRISIETDSTIAIDENLRKQERLEFLEHGTAFLQQMQGVIQIAPEFTEPIGQMFLFAVRTFKAGRDLETSLEKALNQVLENQRQAQANPQPPPPDPKLLAVQQEAQKTQMEAQARAQELQVRMAESQQNFQLKQTELIAKLQEGQARLALDQEEMRGELQIKAQKVVSDIQLKAEEFRNKESIETRKLLAKNGDLMKKPKGFRFFNDAQGNRVAEPIGGDAPAFFFVTQKDGSRVAIPVEKKDGGK